MLDRAEEMRARVAAATGLGRLTIGTVADGNILGGHALVDAFGNRHSQVEVGIRESGLTDAGCGVAAGHVDVALTRGPFDGRGTGVTALRTGPVAALLRSDDELAHRTSLRLAGPGDRQWFRFPDTTDAAWRVCWSGGKERSGPLVRAGTGCRQSVLWNGTVGLAPMDHGPSAGLVMVPVRDVAPSPVRVAWPERELCAPVRSFIDVAVASFTR